MTHFLKHNEAGSIATEFMMILPLTIFILGVMMAMSGFVIQKELSLYSVFYASRVAAIGGGSAAVPKKLLGDDTAVIIQSQSVSVYHPYRRWFSLPGIHFPALAATVPLIRIDLQESGCDDNSTIWRKESECAW